MDLLPRYMFPKATLILSFLTLSFSSLFSQIYVDQSATGANDGSSWEDAFTDLQDALSSESDETQVWIAEGTYYPGEPGDSLASFHLTREFQLYGSFRGTEQALEDRPSRAAGNSTILSGDILGNDSPQDFDSNKEDNVFNVLVIDAVIDNRTIIDRVNIWRGHADGDIEISNRHGRGGGVYCEGAPIFQFCEILDNYALSDGGGIYLDSISGEAPQFYDCVISSNASGDDGGGIEATHLTGEPLWLERTTLAGNTSQEVGGGMHIKSSNLVIRQGAAFDNRSETFGGGVHIEYLSGDNGLETEIRNYLIRTNVASDRGGGIVFYAEDSLNRLILDKVEFVENRTRTSGGGLYVELRGTYAQTTFQISNTCFVGNLAPLENGGGMYIRSSSQSSAIRLDSTVFRENFAALRGGALYSDISENGPHLLTLTGAGFFENDAETGGAIDMNTRNRSIVELRLDETTFSENEANTIRGEGGAINIRAGGEDFTGAIRRSDFLENKALNGGGINLEVAPSRKGSFEFREIRWTENIAVEGDRSPARGGAIYAASDGGELELIIERSILDQNIASLGGAVFMEAQTGASAWVGIDSTLFFRNQASNSAGGLLFLISDEFSRGRMDMYAGEFRENSAVDNVGGMALSIGSDNFIGSISHSRFTQNTALNYGALFVQSPTSRRTNARFSLSNSLVAKNTTPSGAVTGSFSFPMAFTNCTIAENEGIGVEIEDVSELFLQNTLFHNPGFANVGVGDELGQIISLGGNLSGDTSLDQVFGEDDISNIEPVFTGGSYAPYRLESTSPGIDEGVLSDSLPEVDLLGAPRLMGTMVDIGAFEGGFAVSASGLVPDVSWLLYPNPATHTLTLKGDYLGKVQIEIANVLGQTLLQEAKSKQSDILPISLSGLSEGIYVLILTQGKEHWHHVFEKR